MNQNIPDSLKAGDVVARRYVILRHLRDEPCGGVWLAQDRALGVDVALKFLSRRSFQFDAAREALRGEGALALKLRHPHILQVIHFEEREEGVFLVQEPVHGESLLGHLNRLERFRLPYALGLLEQLAGALAWAHQHHEVHHSLDPSNIILEDNTVKLANFSCALPEEEEPRVTRLELRAYVAPEVIQGEPVTPAANVFSLGVLGFRLSAGSLPYPLTFDEPVPYRLENIPVDLEEIPLPLQNLLLQCLAPDPRDRFEDAQAFLAALEQRRESWRTPAYGRWIGWTPERREQAAGVLESASRFCRQFWAGSKGMVGKLTENFPSLAEAGKSGLARRLLIGLAGGLLVLILLVWGGRALFQRLAAPQPSAKPAPAASQPAPLAAPAPGEMKLPQVGGPPLQSGPATAPAAPGSEVHSRPATPAPPKETKVQPPAPGKEHYQLRVATFNTYDQALALKKKMQARNISATVYKGTAGQKTYYVVKAGPFAGRKQAEEVAGRLKSENLAPAAQPVKIKAETSKTSPSRPN